MEFRILGPLEVAVTEAPLSLGGRRQQRILALLLLRAGRVPDLPAVALGARFDEEARRARRALAEGRVEAVLTLGGHTDAVPELTALARAHPRRDRLQAALLVAEAVSGDHHVYPRVARRPETARA
jgi:DNA-binding SARP family transcriptional activator